MKRTLYHGTNRAVAAKIIAEQTLKSFDYLGVGVCYSFAGAVHYAINKCSKMSLLSTEAAILVFELEEEHLSEACQCFSGGVALHDEIGRPLKEVKIFNARIVESCSSAESKGNVAVAAANGDVPQMPVPMAGK